MENLLWLLIVIIFILRGIAKLMKMARPKAKGEPEEPPPLEVEEYFEPIGQPMEEIETKPMSPKPILEEKAVKPTEKIKKEELEVVRALPAQEFLPLLTSAKTIQQGIILSTILGLPKAKRGRR